MWLEMRQLGVHSFNWYLKSQRVNWWAPAAVTFCLVMSYWRSGYKAVLYNLSFHSMAALREGRCFPPGRKKGHSHFHLTREPWSQDHAKACSPGKKVGGKICGGLSRSGCWMESCIQETWDDCSKLNFWQKCVLSKLVSMPVIQPSESSCLFRVGGLTTQDILCSSFMRSEAFWYLLIICLSALW